MWIWWLSVKPTWVYWSFIKLYEKPQDFRRKRLDGFYGPEYFLKERWEKKDERQFQVTSIFERYWWIQFYSFSTSHFAYFVNPERVCLVWFICGEYSAHQVSKWHYWPFVHSQCLIRNWYYIELIGVNRHNLRSFLRISVRILLPLKQIYRQFYIGKAHKVPRSLVGKWPDRNLLL